MKSKREYNRSDLTIETPGGVFACVLCGRRGRGDTAHEADCVFVNDSVTGIRVDGISGGVVFHPRGEDSWWVSPASGKEYCIEKLPECYVMTDEDVWEVKRCRHLFDLRLWVGLNQGVL